MRDRLGEVVGQVRLRDRDRVELGIRQPGHLPRDRRLVVLRPVEAQGERSDRIRSMPGRQSQHGARVEPAAQVAADRHVGAEPEADRLVERPPELFGMLGIRPRRSGPGRSSG